MQESIILDYYVQKKQIKKMISSYVENAEFWTPDAFGWIEVELTPQGTLAEKCRAWPEYLLFYSAGYGTEVAEKKYVSLTEMHPWN
jgi:3-oxoacid CoA-transferase subunit A